MMRKFILVTALVWSSTAHLLAAEHHGNVTFGGLPVPGAVVTATRADKRADKKVVTVTDSQGKYSFPDLADGTWTIEVQMTAFGTVRQDVAVGPSAAETNWELKPIPADQITDQMISRPALKTSPPPAAATSNTPPPTSGPAADKNAPPPPPRPAADGATEANERAADGFLINGSQNNGASSPFAQFPAFGNNRFGRRSLYTGGLGVIFDNAALDARSYSLTGQDTPKPSYNKITGLATLGGPLRIPHLLRNGPNFFIGYQWTRNRNASTLQGLMPDAAMRGGDLSGVPGSILDPVLRTPFPGNVIPASRISPQAQALLGLYPLPNFEIPARYNYQIPAVTSTHIDALQSRLNKTFGRRDQVYGDFAFQNSRTDTPNVFDFLDTTDTLGLNTGVNWSHRYGQRLFVNLGFRFNRFSTRVTPFFANRENVSGAAGIAGNDQTPVNWGPPALTFSSGIAGVSDAQSAWNRNQTSSLSDAMLWSHNRHNLSFGGDFRRQEFNYLTQQDARGAFTFTSAATGSDFGDFLLGIPDAESIAFGNADKYFRASVYDAYVTDDWRLSPEFTLNAGVRWEYGAPLTELYGRLVNLDVASGFAAEAPVVANDPRGSLTGMRYPASLIKPDKNGFEPRIGIAWRPLAGSSLVIRAGYGTYYNTSVYQTIATQMAQQSPLSKSLNVQNSAANPLTLASGLNVTPSNTPNTFGVDPNFRVGYVHNWQASVQRDLPGSLQLTATYLGIKGTRQMQEFLPNTYAPEALDPCPLCPAGYAYLTSNGNSTREAGQVQLRRRLHSGFTATLLYTYSKSIDDAAALGGQPGFSQQNNNPQNGQGPGLGTASAPGPINLTIAQNWLDLGSERGLSSFDQRHLLNLQLQYTTGMGMAGGTLLSGWKGAALKDWTFLAQVTAGSGLPLTPIYLIPVPGTAVTGTIRPEYTGAPLYSAPAGFFLNPGAYVAPPEGQWGNAGRNSIAGPSQFSLNASLGRTFRVGDRLNLDTRIDSTNALNHVNFTSWNTVINNAQFGLPTAANAMRAVLITARLRF
jgi:hypothetical protein